MRPRQAALVAVVAFLVYLGATCRPFFAFALSHPRSFGAWSLLHLLDVSLLQPALLAMLLLGARALGERLFGRAMLVELGEERPLFALALGLGALSLLIAAVGLVAWSAWTALAFWGALAALALSDRKRSRPVVRALPGAEALASVVVAMALGCAWVQAAAPPTSWDALAYHLEVPKRWLQAGRVGYDPSLRLAKAPLEVQALYLPALSLGRDALAQLLHLAFAALCLAAVVLFGRRRLGARAAALAAAVFACQPLFTDLAGTANVDFAVCFFGLLAVWAFELWRERGGRRLLALSAALAGLTCGAKLTGLWLAAALTLVVSARLWRARSAKAAAGDLSVWAAVGAAAGGAWYALNWLWLGDPVWPFFARFFGAGPAAQALFERLRAATTEGVAPTVGHLLALPYLLVARGAVFGDGPQYLAAPFLVAGAWLLARGHRPRSAAWIGSVCAVYMLCWFFVGQVWRYALVVFPWACLAVGAALDDAWTAGRAARAAAAAAMLALGSRMLAGQQPSNQLFALFAARPASSGQPWRERYLSLSLPHYELYRWIDAELPAQARLLLYGDVRAYYLRHPCVIGDPLNDFRVNYASVQSSGELEARLRELGVTHLIVRPDASAYRGDAAYYRHADAMMRGFLAERALLLRQSNGLSLYAMPASPTAGPAVGARD